MPRRYEEPLPMGLAGDDPCLAVLETARGPITIRLRPDLAPQSVNSFVFLAREGFYDGTTFHRVIPGFIAQGGDPTGRGHGGPGYRLRDELSDEPFAAGAVGLANSGPDSNGSQFFIALDGALHVHRKRRGRPRRGASARAARPRGGRRAAARGRPARRADYRGARAGIARGRLARASARPRRAALAVRVAR